MHDNFLMFLLQKYTPAYYKWVVNGKQGLNQDTPCISWTFVNQTTGNVSVSVVNALGVYNDYLCVEVSKGTHITSSLWQ